MDLEVLELLIQIANKYSFPAFCIALLLLVLNYTGQKKQEKLNEELISELRKQNSTYENQMALLKEERNQLMAKFRNTAIKASQLAELQEAIQSNDRVNKLTHILNFSRRHEDDLRFFNVSPIKRLAEDKSLGIRRYAAKSLARIKSQSGFEALLDLVDTDPHPAIKVFALYLSGKYLPESPDLKRIFTPRIQRIYEENPSPMIVQEAAWAINKMDDSFICQQTYKPNTADSKCLAFVLIKGLAPTNQTLVEDFDRINRLSKYGVMEVGVVYGTYNTIIKVLSDNINDLNQTILRDLQDLPWVESTRTLIVINEKCISHWTKASITYQGSSLSSMSYILFSTPASDTHGLISCLWDYSFSQSRIVEAAGVYGEADVIARIEAATDQDRDNLICRIIKELSPLIKSCEVLTVQTGTFNQDDTRNVGCLFQSLSIRDIPDEYVPLSENTVKEYSNIK